MILHTETKEYKNIPFEQYIKLGGYSHSWLKKEVNGITPEFKVTDKMRLGSMVDAFLTQPDEIDFSSPLFGAGRTIAMAIQKEFGGLIKHFEPQVSYTSTLVYNGLKMKTTGRVDWRIPGQAIIDLKVTEATDLKVLIKYMGYDNQMWNYTGMEKVDRSFILAYNPKLKKMLPIIEIKRNPRNEFWESKVMKFGTV